MLEGEYLFFLFLVLINNLPKKIFKNKSLGIIGCRECSEYGKEIAQKFSYYLAASNINIVSGLARGIDM